MGITKSDIYNTSQKELAHIAKALGHPARIAILQHLIKEEGCVCGSLVEEIGLAQATISQHLKELKTIDLIKGEISGTSVCYCINEEKWRVAAEMVAELFASGEKEKCC